SSRLAWKTLDLSGAARVMRTLSPKDRSAAAIKMTWNGTEPAVANAVLMMSYAPMSGFGATEAVCNLQRNTCESQIGLMPGLTEQECPQREQECLWPPLLHIEQPQLPTPPTEQEKAVAALQAYWTSPFWVIVRTASMAASAYHGYRRNDSIGWALWW